MKINGNMYKQLSFFNKYPNNLLSAIPDKSHFGERLINEISSNTSNSIKNNVLYSINFSGIKQNKPVIDANKILKTEYGIESNLSENTAKIFLEAVEDFTGLNNKNMFNGLKLISIDKTNDTIYDVNYSVEDNTFEISFNNGYNKKELKNISEERYNLGYTASDNYKYIPYSLLGRFLCFKHNPYAYDIKTKYTQKDGPIVVAGRKLGIFALDSFSSYNSHYIAAKMSEVPTTKQMDEIYETLIGADLNFPQTETGELKGVEHSFKSIKEVQDYLAKYNIKSDFHDLMTANLAAGAIDDFIKANNNKKLFNGLEISYTVSEGAWDGKTTSGYDELKNEITRSNIVLNIACDWKRPKKIAQMAYNKNHSSSNNPKNTIYHELGHWLHFHNDPLGYYVIGHKYNDDNPKKAEITEEEKNIFGRVSNYATKSPVEFVAEYISAKMNGFKYPKIVDNYFKMFYGKGDFMLKFPNSKKTN